MKKSCRVS